MAFNISAASLSGGDQFTAISVEGNLSVQCMGTNNGPSYATAHCESEILNPAEYSYFQGPNIDADTVSLQATWENGKTTKSKTANYDSVKGKSTKSFNLWIQTLLQRPLLNYGKNIVKYTLTKNGKTVEEGNFNVEVVKGGNSVCPRMGYFTSNNSQDCAFPNNFCSTFFQQNNYCQ